MCVAKLYPPPETFTYFFTKLRFQLKMYPHIQEMEILGWACQFAIWIKLKKKAQEESNFLNVYVSCFIPPSAFTYFLLLRFQFKMYPHGDSRFNLPTLNIDKTEKQKVNEESNFLNVHVCCQSLSHLSNPRRILPIFCC